MPSLNLNTLNKLYYEDKEVKKLFKGTDLIYYPEIPDPFAGNVVLYLKNSLSDISGNNLTVNNKTTVTTSLTRSIDGINHSLYFDGNNYLEIQSNLFQVGSGDFTLEFWTYWNTSTNVDKGLWCFTTALNNSNFYVVDINGYEGAIFFNQLQSLGNNFGSFSSYLNKWVHIAFVRTGSSMRIFLNGTDKGTVSCLANYNFPVLVIGTYKDTTKKATMYLSHFRFTTAARYTSSFYPIADTHIYLKDTNNYLMRTVN